MESPAFKDSSQNVPKESEPEKHWDRFVQNDVTYSVKQGGVVMWLYNLSKIKSHAALFLPHGRVILTESRCS